MITTKICTKCNTEKPLSEFYFRNDTQKYKNQCKACKNLYTKEYLRNNKKVISPKRREYIKQYEKDNAEKIRKRMREYRLKNKEKLREQMKKYREANKEDYIEYQKTYKVENKEKIRAKRREYYLNNKNLFQEMLQIYRKTEKGKMAYKNSNNKRRAKIKEGSIKTEDLQLLIENSKTCYWCNSKLNKKEKAGFHLDHYVPLAKGGTHTIDNIVISCPDCNLRKNAKDPYEFALTKGKLL